MTLKDKLVSTTFLEVSKYLKRIDPVFEEQKEGYKKAYDKLTKIKPKAIKKVDYLIEVFKTKEVEVGHTDSDYPVNMSYIPWNQLLAMKVTSPFNVDFTVACILREMVTYGFTEKDIKQSLKALEKVIKNSYGGKQLKIKPK